MSDYRHQPLTDQWVLVASDREERPNDYRPRTEYAPDRPCPFCVGQEPSTPEAIAFYPGGRGLGGWLVRVVPNKFPALRPVPNQPIEFQGPHQTFRGFGLHELVVLSPRHVESFSDLDAAERGTALVAFQDRIRLAWTWSEIRHAVVFQNCRSDAGASIQHVHTQVVATAVIPAAIRSRFRRQEHQRRHTGRTVLQQQVAFEEQAGCRVLFESHGLTAFCPFASRMAYEIWIAPSTSHEHEAFEGLSTDRLHHVADAMHRAIVMLEKAIPGVAYNFVLHLPPRSPHASHSTSAGHWFIELFPRLNKLAGFELATGCMINQVPPETAAERLRG